MLLLVPNCKFVIMVYKDKPLIQIYEQKMGEQDLIDSGNFELMKAYVPRLLVGVTIPHPDLISCKEHRVRALLRPLAF